MMLKMNGRSLVIGAALITAILGTSPAAAVLQGDCNDDGTTAINEVQRCANIFLETQELVLCPPCDQNGNGMVAINEVAGAANCFLDTTSAGCRMSTPGPGEATNTPTNTPAATATNTEVAVATNTPVTPTATSTPVTPTSTPVPPTETPTNTPVNTPTATSGGPEVILMGIKAGGGTNGNCRGTCVGGSNVGGSCAVNDECPGSTCSPTSVCNGGSNNGNACTVAGNCPGGTCAPARVCVGGPYDGIMCSNGRACGGCDPARVCTGAGVPLPCCTGNQAGATCPVLGSCAIIQAKILSIRAALNGVCIPRKFPPGDLACTTDAECSTCVGGDNEGDACLSPSHCTGGGTCSGAGACRLAQVGAIIGEEDGNGERPVTLKQDTLVLNPAYLGSLGTACVAAGGDGAGIIDCNGGRSGLDFELSRDHNTTPGMLCTIGPDAGQPCTSNAQCGSPGVCASGNSGSANGLPDDPECDDTFVTPAGVVNYTCTEGEMQCSGGVNGGMICTMDEDCPGSSCGLCNIGLNGGPHAGVCNSPTTAESSGMFDAGDAAIAFPLAIILYSGNYTPGIGQTPPEGFGPDGLPCTEDDTGSGNAVPVALSTGLNSVFVYDANNTAGSKIGPGESCLGPCVASVNGRSGSCNNITTDGLGGAILGGGFPALDTPANDIATIFQFELVAPE